MVTTTGTAAGAGRVMLIPVDALRPNPAQPRGVFDPEGLQALADSIRQYGVLQPLSVRLTEDGPELIAGERRLRAARLAGLRTVPCLPVGADEEASAMLALIENIQRRDLDFWEQAQGIARLMHRFSITQEQAARRLGMSQSAVANKLRILRLPEDVLQQLRDAGLGERHARALLRLPDESAQRRAARLAALDKGLDTPLGRDFEENGVELSGGEAQKTAIARALYKNAPFIILDEPTAALDPLAEAEIYGKFNELVDDRTAIYISHRLSSCRFCDEIAVFDGGHLAQMGSHEALLSQPRGLYAQLWNAQAQYYTEA